MHAMTMFAYDKNEHKACSFLCIVGVSCGKSADIFDPHADAQHAQHVAMCGISGPRACQFWGKSGAPVV